MIATFDRDDKVPGEGEADRAGLASLLPAFLRPPQRAGRGRAADRRRRAAARSRCRAACMRARPSPSRATSGSATQLRRETEFSDVQLRGGGTGSLIVTSRDAAHLHAARLAVTEVANTVFREEVKAGEKSGVPVREAPADVPWRRTIKADPVMLFRYSAITFNPQRVHYDRTYCIETEAIPAWWCTDPSPSNACSTCCSDSKRRAGRSRPSPSAPARRCSTPHRSRRSAVRPPTARCGAVDGDAQGTVAAQATATFTLAAYARRRPCRGS